MSPRIAIVGAGLAGLTAANHLVDAGVDVTIFERAGAPGGRATTSAHGAYRFNYGPHALYRDGEGHRILTGLGIEPAGHTPIQGKARALLAGELRTLPVGPASLASTDLLGVREKIRFASFLARFGRVDPDRHVGTTIEQWAASVSPDRSSIELLLAIMRLSTYSNAPDLASAAPAVRQLQRALDGGVMYLDGGWGQLVTQLTQRATAAGAVVVDEQISAAEDLLGRFDSAVIAVGSPAATDALLGTTDLAHRAGPPVEAAVLELGVAAVPPDRFILGIDEPLYASVHAPPADLAPVGHSVVCLARYLAPDEQHDAAGTRRQLTELAYRLGIYDADIVERRYLHRMTVAHGLPLATQQGLSGRPGVATALHRIATAGDWVGSAGLLADASIASGRQAAHHLLEAPVGVVSP